MNALCTSSLRICLLMSLLIVPAGKLHAKETQVKLNTSNIASYSYKESLRLGKRIYREGILPDGSTMKAFVQGDIPVDGQLFACVRCHRRSGLGTTEGYVVTLPINSSNLFRSRVSWDTRRRHSRPESTASLHRKMPAYLLDEPLRQAYTDQTLATAIRNGVDPAGRALNPLMPKYELDESAMRLLIQYLQYLTNTYSQGVTDTSIHFATIVTDDVNKADKQAMLSVLQAHIHDRNSQVRNQLKRSTSGAFNRRELDVSYRLLELSVWELKGPEDSWYQQLENYIRKDPVFAILGGISNGSWAPIHRFSEKQGIPVLFPVTDRPVISTQDWYTIYFSKGFYQEGESVARFLRKNKKSFDKTRIIQVFNKGSDGELAANGFANTWKKFNEKVRKGSELIYVDSHQPGYLEKIISNKAQATIILFWDVMDEITSNMLKEKVKNDETEMIFMSSRLLQENYSLISDELRDVTYITYPYSAPGDKDRHISTLRTWLDIKRIPPSNLKIQSEMYFLGWMLSDALVGMKSEFYREYFLERIEMMKDHTHTISAYPRLSLGPDQRYASKGCYIVQLEKGDSPTFRLKSEWVIH